MDVLSFKNIVKMADRSQVLVKRSQESSETSTSGVVVTTLDFQAERPGFKPWSDLYSRSSNNLRRKGCLCIDISKW